MNKTFVPIYKFCKDKNIQRQKVYRMIREGKISPDKVKIIEKVVKRMVIDSKTEIN